MPDWMPRWSSGYARVRARFFQRVGRIHHETQLIHEYVGKVHRIFDLILSPKGGGIRACFGFRGPFPMLLPSHSANGAEDFRVRSG